MAVWNWLAFEQRRHDPTALGGLAGIQNAGHDLIARFGPAAMVHRADLLDVH